MLSDEGLPANYENLEPIPTVAGSEVGASGSIAAGALKYMGFRDDALAHAARIVIDDPELHPAERDLRVELRDSHTRRAGELSERLEQELSRTRLFFGGLSDEAKEQADTLLRFQGAPRELVGACEAQAQQYGQTPNFITWLSAKPEDANQYGATSAQLEELVLWNVQKTQEAIDSGVVDRLLSDSRARLHASVQAGQLSASLEEAPHISRVVVGDILDAKFLGYEGGSRAGEYRRKTGDLLIWPYDSNADVPRTQHAVNHEEKHARGGFEPVWLDEAVTEMITNVTDGKDPFVIDGTYDDNILALAHILTKSSISVADLSSFYPGQDTEKNTQALFEGVKEVYFGYDVLRVIDNVYSEAIGGDPANMRHRGMKEQAFRATERAAWAIKATIDRAALEDNPTDAATFLRLLSSIGSDPAEQIAFKHVIEMYETTDVQSSAPEEGVLTQ